MPVLFYSPAFFFSIIVGSLGQIPFRFYRLPLPSQHCRLKFSSSLPCSFPSTLFSSLNSHAFGCGHYVPFQRLGFFHLFRLQSPCLAYQAPLTSPEPHQYVVGFMVRSMSVSRFWESNFWRFLDVSLCFTSCARQLPALLSKYSCGSFSRCFELWCQSCLGDACVWL